MGLAGFRGSAGVGRAVLFCSMSVSEVPLVWFIALEGAVCAVAGLYLEVHGT